MKKDKKMKNKRYYFTLLSLSMLLLPSCSRTLEGDVIITKTNIIDIKTGDISKNMDVVIIGDSIASIVAHSNQSNYLAEKVIDASDKFLIPGLWDMHTHTWWAYEDFIPLLIANGITGIRDMFGDMETVKQIRTEIADGTMTGPIIISSGNIVDGDPPSWDGSDIADTPEKGREIVREQKAEGVDFIKVYDDLKKDVYFAIADECKKQNISFQGHVPDRVTLKEAVNAGQATIEHFYGILEQCSDVHQSTEFSALDGKEFTGFEYDKRLEFILNTFDESKAKEVIDLLSKSNSWVSPTLMVHKGFQRNIDIQYTKDDRIHYMPDYLVRRWNIDKDTVMSKAANSALNIERKFYLKMTSFIKTLHDNGTKFLAGTDYGNDFVFPGFSLHEELEAYVVEAGLSPLAALQTATINPAIFLKRENELGTVEAGKLASLLILNKNPLEDIRNTKSIHSVIVSGQHFDGDTLRAGIEKIAILNRLPKIDEVLSPIIQNKGIAQAISEYRKLKLAQPEAYNFGEGQLNSLGYQLLAENKIVDAIKIFELNVKEFPKYANGFDSLGDAYLKVDEKQKAIEAWEKAVILGSEFTKEKLNELKGKK